MKFHQRSFCRIQNKFEDNIFSRWSGLLSSISTKFIWFIILFCTHLATFFSGMRCSFKQNTRKLFIDLRNLSENNYFLFLFSIFGDIFWTRITFERYDFQSATVILFIHGITKQFIKKLHSLKEYGTRIKIYYWKKNAIIFVPGKLSNWKLKFKADFAMMISVVIIFLFSHLRNMCNLLIIQI